MSSHGLPDPALIVLVGAAGAGKSTWATTHYRSSEIVSADALRAVVGSGPADLEASTEAFDLLDRIVDARLRRRMATVVDTLGLEPGRRRSYLERARAAGLPAVLVVVDTSSRLCRTRNAGRDRPVPAAVLTDQLRKVAALGDVIGTEGWDQVVRIGSEPGRPPDPAPVPATVPPPPARTSELSVVLQVSRFPGTAAPGPWLRDLAAAAADVGFAGIALMDHLIQVPQVGRPFDPILETYSTLGFLAAQDRGLRLGALVSPVTLRTPGVLAKTVATLDVLSGGRAFCGLGAGWWAREHAAYGIPFPAAGERLDDVERGIETLRALWAPGTKPYEGRLVQLPETTCYPRPVGRVPIIVGGSGERRTLRIAATAADGCNVRADLETLPGKIEVLRRYCADVGRDPEQVEITVLDLPVLGTDREDTARRIERLRGRTAAASFIARHPAGTAADHAARYRQLAGLGVRTVFCSLPDLSGAADLERCRPLVAQFT